VDERIRVERPSGLEVGRIGEAERAVGRLEKSVVGWFANGARP